MEVMETNECDFPFSARQNELLKAPTRKRKPDAECRVRRRVVRMTWDVDNHNTSTILDEMGVTQIPEIDTTTKTTTTKMTTPPTEQLQQEQLKQQHQRPTPKTRQRAGKLEPPGAPKVDTTVPYHINTTLRKQMTQIPNAVPFIEPQGTTDGILFMARRLRPDKQQGPVCNHFDKLSDEMLLSIFKWLQKPVLTKTARVCKRWNRLCFDETLWRRLDLNNKILQKGSLGRVLQRGVVVLRLAKAEIRTPIFSGPTNVFNKQKFSKVQYLDLSMAVVSPEALESVLSTCHLLRKLSLENCTVSDQVCRYIGQNINLEVLNLSMCQGITENGLVPICNNLKRLDALNVAWTGMSRGALLYLVICLPRGITKLNLSGCRELLLDEDIPQLCNGCPSLKELDLSDATVLTSQAVEYIATMLRGLEYIALSRCYHIMPSSLPLLGNIHTLLALDVFGMLREAALIHLREALPNIEINKFPFSSIARPTTGIRRTSIWGLRVRDIVV